MAGLRVCVCAFIDYHYYFNINYYYTKILISKKYANDNETYYVYILNDFK